jgi:hypothetical protein
MTQACPELPSRNYCPRYRPVAFAVRQCCNCSLLLLLLAPYGFPAHAHRTGIDILCVIQTKAGVWLCELVMVNAGPWTGRTVAAHPLM